MSQVNDLRVLHDFQYGFAAYIRDPIGVPCPLGVTDERISVYTRFIPCNIESPLLACFQSLRSILGADRWTSLVQDFITRHRCASPFYRQIPDEFVRYLQDEHVLSHGDPPFLLELAHFEWMELVLAVSDKDINWELIDPDGDVMQARPKINPTAEQVHYAYPVHTIGSSRPAPVPEPEGTNLLMFRDLQDTVRFLMLNKASARLLKLLAGENLTGLEAINRVATELDLGEHSRILSYGSDVLKDLCAQQVILGTII